MRVAIIITTTLLFANAPAQTLYKYRGDDGQWVFTDRQPPEHETVEKRKLPLGASNEKFAVNHRIRGDGIELVADNPYFIPVEVALHFGRIEGIEAPTEPAALQWVVPQNSQEVLLRLQLIPGAEKPTLEYRFEYLAGDPAARHSPKEDYRAPYAISADYEITQAYPDKVTHTTPDSFHAIDIAMPIGTDIFAARGGIVFDVATNNFKGGTDPKIYAQSANVVRILHDDGTYAVYAHLNWNSIRVRPGDVVKRGQYIADSGNTGYSSGPHLHFVVLRNVGMKIVSVPVEFKGARSATVVPAAGKLLTAH